MLLNRLVEFGKFLVDIDFFSPTKNRFVANTGEFQGNVVIQATLNDQPSIQAEWFDVDTFNSPSPSSAIDGRTVVGSFTFMRARITNFEAGSISITLAY